MAHKLLNYEVLERLGEGARSSIYAVSDPDTRQVYALKHVVRSAPKDLRFIEQVENEFEVSRQFTHPNLRRSFELKLIKTLLMKKSEAFLLMELVDGKPLDVRPLRDLLEIVDAFIKSAQALKALHAMGYAHCDIKPNNILRSDQGEIKVIDFGQACKIGTVKQRIQGTPDYIAPEQVARRPISAQTDVYNLGATLYWALTASNIPTLYTVNKKGDNSFLLDQTIQTPTSLNPTVPAGLSNLVMECIASRPAKRPADMEQVIMRLEMMKHVLTGKHEAKSAPPMPPEPSIDQSFPPQQLLGHDSVEESSEQPPEHEKTE